MDEPSIEVAETKEAPNISLALGNWPGGYRVYLGRVHPDLTVADYGAEVINRSLFEETLGRLEIQLVLPECFKNSDHDWLVLFQGVKIRMSSR